MRERRCSASDLIALAVVLVAVGSLLLTAGRGGAGASAFQESASTAAATAAVGTPVAMGTPVGYVDRWLVEVTAAVSGVAIRRSSPVGVYVRLDLTVTNQGDERRRFPYGSLRLIDEHGRRVGPDDRASVRLDNDLGSRIPPLASKALNVVFDVAADAGMRFVLTRDADPNLAIIVVALPNRPTPTPTLVPAAATGAPIAYAGGWTVVVVGASASPTIARESASGVFVRVDVLITNRGGTSRDFPFDEMIVRDAAGVLHPIDVAASYLGGDGWTKNFQPGKEEATAFVFDVPLGSGSSFVLESTNDPFFRVAIELAQRG